MGKPIAGENQFPFTLGGIIVDGAKINGETHFKRLYIYQQRSDIMYDLIDDEGVVYEFIEIVWREEDTTLLNYFDNSSKIVTTIKDNSFFIKIQDVPRNIYGFITLIQLNKIKVSTGDYIFFNENDDYSLLSVRCIPSTIQASKNQIIDIGVSFLPVSYPNQSGRWDIDKGNDILSEVGRSLDSNASFKCIDEGHAIVTFNPSANSALAATAQIFITEEIPSYTSFIAVQNNPTGVSLENDDTYFPGDQISISLVFNPISYKPSAPLDVEFDDDVLELLGVEDDNTYYIFQVKDNTTFTGVRTQILFKDGDMNAMAQPIVRQLTSTANVGVSGPRYVRPGVPAQFSLPYYSKPINPVYNWSLQKSGFGTISQTGVYTSAGIGDQRVYLNANGFTGVNYTNTTIAPYVPDMYKYSPNNRSTFFVGEKIQLSVTSVPSSVSTAGGRWRLRHDSDAEFCTVSQNGLLTILKAPENPNSVFYVGYSYNGSSGVGGTIDGTVESLEKTFCILPQGETVEPTSIRMYDYTQLLYIPVGGKTKSYVSVSPWYMTGDKNWTYEMSVPGIVSIDYDPYFNNNYYLTYITINGLSKGQTDITFTCVSNPSIKATYTLTVF